MIIGSTEYYMDLLMKAHIEIGGLRYEVESLKRQLEIANGAK